jgi:hypothetical protein
MSNELSVVSTAADGSNTIDWCTRFSGSIEASASTAIPPAASASASPMNAVVSFLM